MNLDALLNEVDQLHSVSSRLEELAQRHLGISEALVAVAGSVRNSAVVLEVLIATKAVPRTERELQWVRQIGCAGFDPRYD